MLKGRIALVTGASSDIGAAVAKEYAKNGAHVILLGRDLKKLEAVDDIIKVFDGESTIINMDLSDFDKIPLLAASISTRFTKLDILVGNAAIMGDLGLLIDCRQEMWHNIFNINLHANWELIRHLDPLLKLSDSGRVIFITSDSVKMQNPAFWGPFMISKSAIEAMARLYSAETQHTNVKVNLVNPGPVATKMYKKAYPGQDLSLIAQPEDITEIFVKLASEKCVFSGKTHEAQT